MAVEVAAGAVVVFGGAGIGVPCRDLGVADVGLGADVPVGAYLSGGLDSSAITALIHHYTGNRLETFSIAFTDEVGALAEEEGHHPAILTEYGKVTVRWWTHAIGGLHKNDFIMAAKVDELFEDL